MSKKVGVRKVYFWGSIGTFERLVWKHEDGTYWIRWYYEDIQVEQADGCEGNSNGWRTVEAY
jgi:hypothetical protein